MSSRRLAHSQYRIDRNSSRSPSICLATDESLELPDRLDKPVLAINYKNKYLGGAYWKSDENVLVVLADIPCTNAIDMLDLGNSPPSPSFDVIHLNYKLPRP